jgi:heat shock protein HtpX
MEQTKTVGLLVLLSVVFIWIGGIFGGTGGMLIAFVIVGGMNFYAYFYSDKMVLKHYKAIEVNSSQKIYHLVHDLTNKANLPMPHVYIIPDRVPNAFATGRNPENAAVALSEGLLDILNEDEVKAVIAHELSHIRHYDILIGTVAATIAGAISIIANMMQFGAMFGERGRNGMHPILMLVLAIILPLAAMIIQMTISRSREYMADEGAAKLTGHPEWLQSALSKLENANQRSSMKEADSSTAHMFIVNPLSGKKMNFSSLFRTHPSTQDRINRLETLKHGGVKRQYSRSLYER